MAKKNKQTRPRHQCKNHSNKQTTIRCFQCKEYICSVCVLSHDHHRFCSKHCINEYDRKKVESTISPQKQTYYLKTKDILYLTIIFFIIIIFANRLWRPEPSQPESIHETDSITTLTIDTEWSPSVYQDEISFTVVPAVPDSLVLNIWVNNRYFQSVSRTTKISIPAASLQSGENTVEIIATSPKASWMVLRREFNINPPMFSRLDYIRLPGKRTIALTFDAGSNANAVDSIINILNKYNIQATAFLTGTFIRQFPAVVEELVTSRRFIFGNHSWSHPHLTSYPQDQNHQTLDNISFLKLTTELSKTDSLFFRTTGKHLVKLWRAPYGEYNDEILNWAGHLGYSHVGWSRGFDTFDWVRDTTSTIYYTPEQLWEKWKSRWETSPGQFNGAIILMHLGNDRIKPMYPFLHQFIPFAQEQGFEFVDLTVLK